MTNPNTPHNIPPTNNPNPIALEAVINKKYVELFGEEYLQEDTLTLRQQIQEEKINLLQSDIIQSDLIYRKAMAEYKRSKEAEVTKYSLEKEILIPSTVKCQEKGMRTNYGNTDQLEPSFVVTNINKETTEDILQVKINAVEKEEIETGLEVTHAISNLSVSNKKRKRQLWAYNRNLARKRQRALSKQNSSQP